MMQPSLWLPPRGLERLQAVVAHAWERSPVQRERLESAGLTPGQVSGPESLWALPVLRKESLGQLQAVSHPFGGLLGEGLDELARLFLSPGAIYDPQGRAPDYWRFGLSLRAAGFAPGDLVINCFSYHLTPAGFMFDDAARSIGCVVIPAGVGQQEMQVKVMAETGVTGYVGLPSYLLALLEKATSMGVALGLRRAVVTGEPLPAGLRAQIEQYGLTLFQAYGTADLGLLGYECGQGQGLHLDDGVVLELCDPEGQPVPMGEVGEVVVTLLNNTYPLIRFGTGDLSALLPEPCPCDRPALRLKGWLGRANGVAKVRGMFLYPHQLEAAMAGFGGQVERWRAVVERGEDHRDRLTLQVEGSADPGQVGEAVLAATRLNPAVVLVPSGTLPETGPSILDARKWEE